MSQAQETPDPAEIQILLAEFDRLKSVYLHMEEYLKTKLNIYITLMSAGIGFILISQPVQFSRALIVLAIMLVIGFLTFIGLLNIDMRIISTVVAMRRIQAYFLKHNKEAAKYLSHDYWENPSRFTSVKEVLRQAVTAAGEKTVIGISNGLTFASLITLTIYESQSIFTRLALVVVFLCCFGVFCIFQMMYVRFTYKLRKPQSARFLTSLDV